MFHSQGIIIILYSRNCSGLLLCTEVS